MTERDISFDEFSAALLGDWLVPERETGQALVDPRQAAAMACYEATVVHSGKRGTVLIACSDGACARAAMSFLSAFFEDQPRLVPLVGRISGDAVELKGGMRILVSSAPRKPRDLLTTIRLVTPRADEVEKPEPTNRQVARSIMVMADRVHRGVGSRNDEKRLRKIEARLRAASAADAVFFREGWYQRHLDAEEAKLEREMQGGNYGWLAKRKMIADEQRKQQQTAPTRTDEHLRPLPPRMDNLPENRKGRPAPRVLHRRPDQR